jgi:hypothetical protein
MAVSTGLVLFILLVLVVGSLVLDKLTGSRGRQGASSLWTSVVGYILGFWYRSLYIFPWIWYCRHAQLQLYAARKLRCCLSKTFSLAWCPVAITALADTWLATSGSTGAYP